MNSNVLSPETLNVERIIADAGAGVAERGRAYYRQTWRMTLDRLGTHAASVRVQGSLRYHVEFLLSSDGKLLLWCECPYADEDEAVVCKHKIAAALFLRDQLRNRPRTQAAPSWESVLTRAARAPRAAAHAAVDELLFFSLQQRGTSWAIAPYTLAADLLPAGSPHDAEALARIVAREKLSPRVEKIQPRYGGWGNERPRRFVNVTREQASLVKTLSVAQGYYASSYGSGSSLDFGVLFRLLIGAPLYTGTDKNPLARPLRIVSDTAHIELEIDTDERGLRLRPLAVAGAETFPIGAVASRVISHDPLWMLAGDSVLPLDAATDAVALFQENAEIVVPAQDEHLFFERHLSTLAERFPLRGETITWQELDVAFVPRLYLSEAGGEIGIVLRFAYGDYELACELRPPSHSIRRDPHTNALVRIARRIDTEAERREALAAQTYGLKRGGKTDTFLLRSRTHPFDFLMRDVPRLAADGYEIYGEEELASARVNRNRPKISFVVASGIDWFDVKTRVDFGTTEASLAEIRRAFARRERFVKLADGTIGEIPPEWLEQYRHIFALSDRGEKNTDTEGDDMGDAKNANGDSLRLRHHHLPLLDELLANAEDARGDKEFTRRRERLRNFAGIEHQRPPEQFTGELRPYQQAGLDWLHFLREYNFGGCLADDMGTGKTIVTLAFLQTLKERKPSKRASLLVVPRSLVFNWEREAARFTPALRVLNHATAERTSDVSDFDDYDLVLTTYGVLLRDVETLMHYEFAYLILDEAQAIKNPAAETAKAVRLLRGSHRLTLTGTPVENNTLELWSQFAFLNPGLLGSADYFRREFATPIERDADEAAAQTLRKIVHPFILRRTKDEVAKDLPARTERTILCDMEPAQRKLYDETRDYYAALLLKLIEDEGIKNARFKVLEGLLRLRQICNHPRLYRKTHKGTSSKFELLIETLTTLHAENHKALVFSQFVQMLKLVQGELKRRRLPFAYLDGQTTNRQQRVDDFQNDPALPFFLISLKAGGTGLNLTAADYVIHIDPWWNPAVEMQATDRTHRIGQDKPVFVYKLVVRDSVEEKIVQLQERKRNLVTRLIATEGSFFKTLTADDIKTLFT